MLSHKIYGSLILLDNELSPYHSRVEAYRLAVLCMSHCLRSTKRQTGGMVGMQLGYYLSKHCVFAQQSFYGILAQLILQVLERSINAVAVQLVPAVSQHHCLQQVTVVWATSNVCMYLLMPLQMYPDKYTLQKTVLARLTG